jgi:hypothetical protein
MSRRVRTALLAPALLAVAAVAAHAVPGDVDGDGAFGAEDVLLVQRALRNSLALTPAQAAAANVAEDFTGDPPVPLVDVRDLGVLLRRIGCRPAVCFDEKEIGPGQYSECDYHPVVAAPRYALCDGPRVVVDTSYRNFHRVESSYSGFAKLLYADGYDLRVLQWRKPSDGVLTQFQRPFGGLPPATFRDVLAIITAKPPPGFMTPVFDATETDAIADRVEAGHPLLLVADHDEFGRFTALGQRLGLDLVQGNYAVPENLTKPYTILDSTPLAAALTDGVATLSMNSVMAFRAHASSPPNVTLTPILVHPTLSPPSWIAVAVEVGDARVFVSGDAGVFASQTIVGAVDGLPEPGEDDERFLLNILHWLDGSLDP